MDIFVLLLWLVISIGQTLWSLFLIVAVFAALFSKRVRDHFTEFVRLVTKTAWNALTHIHWFKRLPVEETEVGGHLAVVKSKRCRCGYFKKHIEVL